MTEPKGSGKDGRLTEAERSAYNRSRTKTRPGAVRVEFRAEPEVRFDTTTEAQAPIEIVEDVLPAKPKKKAKAKKPSRAKKKTTKKRKR